MPVPVNKEELLLSIRKNYQKLCVELATVTDEESGIKNMAGHQKNTLMSPANLVGYLVGWGELVLKWHHKKEIREEVVFPEEGYKWNELGLLAQKFYDDYQNLSFPDLKRKLDDVVAKILVVIEGQSNEMLYHTLWYAKWTFGRMIQFNTASPYLNATGRIKKWRKEISVNAAVK